MKVCIVYLIFLINALSIKGQETISDLNELLNNYQYTTYIVGETHPSNIWRLYKHDSHTTSLLVNYSEFQIELTNVLISNKKINQVILELPVFMEYNFNKYYETEEIKWLEVISFDSIIMNHFVYYTNMLKNNDIHIRCIDIPFEKFILESKLTLLDILLDASLNEDSPSDDSNSKIMFTDEILQLKSNLFSKKRSVNLRLINLLTKSMNDQISDYQLLLKSNYLLYMRILNSLSTNYEYYKSTNREQIRDDFLYNQFQRVNDSSQLIFIGNSHIENTKSILYKRRYSDYQNFFDQILKSSLTYFATITVFEGINSNRDFNKTVWEKEMQEIQYIEKSNYKMSVFESDELKTKAITVIKY